MAIKLWQGDADTRAQAKTVTITTNATSATFTLTATDEKGNTAAESTTGGSAASDTASLLNDAWNASGSPVCQRVTGTVSAAVITLTAATAGVPFSVATTATTTTAALTSADTVSSRGPNDFNVTENWQGGVKATSDDEIMCMAGAGAILYGLDQTSTGGGSAGGFGGFSVEEGFSNNIGGTDDAALTMLLSEDKVRLQGTGYITLDLKASAVAPAIYDTYAASAGSYGLKLAGTAMTTVNVYKGVVGIGVEPDDTTTSLTNLNVNYISSQSGDSNVTIGSGVTISGHATNAIATVNMNGGVVTSKGADIATVTIGNGTLVLSDDAAISTAVTMNNGRIFHDSSGTVTLATLNGGTYDATRTANAKTISTLKINSGTFRRDPGDTTVTTFSNPDTPTELTVSKI